MKALFVSGLGVFVLLMVITWMLFYRKGRQFALRDRLRPADAIVVLAGTRGNLAFLQGKIRTAVQLYQAGWAKKIICSGKFSAKVTETPTLMPVPELQVAVAQGRLQARDLAPAAQTWDVALGACYMRDQALQMGVPAEAILVENDSLHTRENAEMVLRLLKQQQMRRIILVTSPFHQQRTYLTFAKVFQTDGIEIINHYAQTGEWHPVTWFFSAEYRHLVKSEEERIKTYRAKGDLL